MSYTMYSTVLEHNGESTIILTYTYANKQKKINKHDNLYNGRKTTTNYQVGKQRQYKHKSDNPYYNNTLNTQFCTSS